MIINIHFKLILHFCAKLELFLVNSKEINTFNAHEIRGQRVMLDFDLAAMYGVETRRLNEQVKRNIERFPEDFMFQLTKGELEILKSQIVISNVADNQDDSNWKSQIATSNFVRMGFRKLDIEDILHDQNDINESTRMQLENITLALSELQAKEPKAKPRRRIGFIQI